MALQRFKDTPEATRLSAEDQEKIMHVSLPLGNGNILMATDMLECMGHVLTAGNNFSIAVGVESEREADALFAALSAGGEATMPLEKTFWGDYFGMLTDKFGIQWMVSYTYQQTAGEAQAQQAQLTNA